MNKQSATLICLSVFLVSFMSFSSADENEPVGTFNLAGERDPRTHFFVMESRLINFASNGKQDSESTFRLWLKVTPASEEGKNADRCTCLRFTVQEADGPQVSIPSLKDWTYLFATQGFDDAGQVFGVNHAAFDNLTDENGKSVAVDRSYHVYNAFIDFHAFCDVFGQPTIDGKGIQHLDSVGDTIVHSAAASKAPVNLGSRIKEGSFFQNGEITLKLKGQSVVDAQVCALVEYDSGESGFNMVMEAMPGFEINTVGRSHYFGDIYKSLETKWILMATMKEFVISETTLPRPADKISGIVERAIVIKNISESEVIASLN